MIADQRRPIAEAGGLESPLPSCARGASREVIFGTVALVSRAGVLASLDGLAQSHDDRGAAVVVPPVVP